MQVVVALNNGKYATMSQVNCWLSTQNIVDTFKKEDIDGINIEQILGKNLYSNKYALINYIRDNGVNITKKY